MIPMLLVEYFSVQGPLAHAVIKYSSSMHNAVNRQICSDAFFFLQQIPSIRLLIGIQIIGCKVINNVSLKSLQILFNKKKTIISS